MTDLTDPQPALDDQYHPQNAVGKTINATLITGLGGLLKASVQNTMSRTNHGALGVFTRFGGTVGVFGAVGGAYAFVSTASANLRETEDLYNHFLGGFTGGMIIGVAKRSMVSALGNGLFLGTVLAAVHLTGGSLLGNQSLNADEGRYPTKEEIRKRFRRPYQETINELGEGRGIYGPGYEERRKERLKQNYGIAVPEPFYKSAQDHTATDDICHPTLTCISALQTLNQQLSKLDLGQYSRRQGPMGYFTYGRPGMTAKTYLSWIRGRLQPHMCRRRILVAGLLVEATTF